MRASDAEQRPASVAPAGDTRSSPRRRHVILLPPRNVRPWWRRAGTVAAAASAAVVAFAAIRMSERPQPAAAPVARIYETRAGQRADILLGDGTRITLAPESRLRVAADFGTERRDLYLDGEAFFDVAHDAARPFTVYTANASAHDIGTAFAVRGYTKEGAVQIAVREGVVAMSGVGPLSAGDVGLLASNGKTSVRHGVDVSEVLGWLDGRFYYSDAPLMRVVDDLRRWHGAEIVIGDSSLASLPFTGEMNGLTTRPALDLVARTLGLRVTRQGERFILAADPSRVHQRAKRTSR
jgi:ferric-dicitrate binding protein FerR (iron transport regulator)